MMTGGQNHDFGYQEVNLTKIRDFIFYLFYSETFFLKILYLKRSKITSEATVPMLDFFPTRPYFSRPKTNLGRSIFFFTFLRCLPPPPLQKKGIFFPKTLFFTTKIFVS